jgi:hypothetical protein
MEEVCFGLLAVMAWTLGSWL